MKLLQFKKNFCLSLCLSLLVIYFFNNSLNTAYCAAQQSSAEATEESTDTQDIVVATIGDEKITKADVQRMIILEITPNEYTDYSREAEPIDVNSILNYMLGETAITIQAREDGYLEDSTLQQTLTQFKDTSLVNLLISTHVEDVINITDEEIQDKIQSDPNLTPESAREELTVSKASEIVNDYYEEINTKYHVLKLIENYPVVLAAHKRLYDAAQNNSSEKYITLTQVQNDLTDEEKNTNLMTYDGGKTTLQDWFEALCRIAPASRPNFNERPELVERLLEMVIQLPLFVYEAQQLGIDKRPEYLEQQKSYENVLMLTRIQQDQYNKFPRPSDEEIKAFYDNNKELFRQNQTIQMKQIWVSNRQQGQTVKDELDNGGDFAAVKEQYSLVKDDIIDEVTAQDEGLFWNELWKAEAGQIIGPIKGFYESQIKWRVVQIEEKYPGELPEYANDMDNIIITLILRQKIKDYFTSYGEELLEKYPYEIYYDKLTDVNPLEIP